MQYARRIMNWSLVFWVLCFESLSLGLMSFYFYISLAAIITQVLFLFHIYSNYHYALAKYKRKCRWYRPPVVLIVPCKGKDLAFQKNITSFFNQDYEGYLLWFVVADQADAAYGELCKLKELLSAGSKALDIRVLVAGAAKSCSQKVHNLLYCFRKIPDDVEIMAFADSDVCVRSDWLSHLVYPLRKSKYGAATGHRWFVPRKNNLASLALSAVNAKIVQLLGKSPFNQVWGGSMAVRADVFRRLGIDKIWEKALSDDASLGRAVKKAGLKVAFVPACLVASYEFTTWPKQLEFGRRQFLITRISAPNIWWTGLACCLYSVLGLWAGTALAVYAALTGQKNLAIFIAVPVVFFIGQLIRAILRQRMIAKLLPDDRPKMRMAAAVDILLFWLWSLLLLVFIVSSTFGRTITWRGVRYKLLGPAETLILGKY